MLRAAMLGISCLAMTVAGCASAPGAASSAAVEEAEQTMSATAPAKAIAIEDKYADNNGVKIHYIASGEGPLVVLVHGFPDYSGSWNKLIPELNDGYRVVALDTRGYNLSDQPENEEDYAMANLVGDIAAVIAAEGRPSATVIGHDWGAAISWQFAFALPQMLDNLVIMSVPHPTSFAQELASNPVQQQNSAYARNFQKEGSEDNLTAEGLAAWVQDPEMKPKYIEAFKRSSFKGMMSYYRMNYPRTTSPQSAAAPPPPPPHVPLLVIHGMKDTALMSAGHNNTWEHVSKDTSMLMVPDAGHFVQHDAADLVNQTIRNWLDMRKAGPAEHSSYTPWLFEPGAVPTDRG